MYNNLNSYMPYILSVGYITVPMLMRHEGISYTAAKDIIDRLVAQNSLRYAGGITYKPLSAPQPRTEEPPDVMPDFHRRKIEEYRRRRAMYFLNEQDDDDDDDDDDEDDDDDDDEDDDDDPFAELQKFTASLKESGDLTVDVGDDDDDDDDDGDGGDSGALEELLKSRDTAISNLAGAIKRIAEKKAAQAPPEEPKIEIKDNEMFEKIEQLVRSNKNMGRRGAIEKVEHYLEVLQIARHDYYIALYTRVLSELEKCSDYDYNKIRKMFSD